MTWPVTLARLPRAGAISKPQDYKQNVQKWRAFWKNWASTGNSLKISNQKNQRIQSSYGEQNKRTTRPWRQKLNLTHVARKKKSEANLKKAFRKELFELCKTRTKKSSPDLFKFYLFSAGHDMANDAGRATTCRRNFKAPRLQTERTKNEGPSEKMSFNGEQFENFKLKKPRNPIFLWRTKQKNHNTLKAKTENEPCSQEEINWRKTGKNIQNKLFGLCKTRTKKSSPDLFNFYVSSTGHDMATDTGRAAMRRRNFKAPWLQKTERANMKGLLKKWSLTGNSFKFSNQKDKISSNRMENKTNDPQDPKGKI